MELTSLTLILPNRRKTVIQTQAFLNQDDLILPIDSTSLNLISLFDSPLFPNIRNSSQNSTISI